MGTHRLRHLQLNDGEPLTGPDSCGGKRPFDHMSPPLFPDLPESTRVTIVRPSNNGVLKANLPYFEERKTSIKEQAFANAASTFMSYFDGQTCVQKDPLEVSVNPDAQYGGGYDGTKSKVIRDNLQMILNFCSSQRRNRVMWTMAGKVEHLPYQKVFRDLKQRTICYPPGHFDILAKTLFEPFTEMFLNLQALDPTGCMYTQTIFGGAFDHMLKPLETFRWILKGDISGFDRSHLKRIWDVIKAVMKKVFPQSAHSDIDYVLEEMWNSLVFMPNGDVCFMERLKSGSPATTLMNCLVHLFIFMYMYYRGVDDMRRIALDENIDEETDDECIDEDDIVSWAEIYKMIRPLYYGDDHLLATNHRLIASFKWRSRIYGELGFTLKKEDDLVHQIENCLIPPKMTFLGNSPRKINGSYRPVGNCEKYAQVFLVQSANSTEIGRAAQLYSYCLMSAFDDEWFIKFKRAFQRLGCSSYITLPSQRAFQLLISGEESFLLPPVISTEAYWLESSSKPVKIIVSDFMDGKTSQSRPRNTTIPDRVPRSPGSAATASLVQAGNLESRLLHIAARREQRSERILEAKRHKRKHGRSQIEREKQAQKRHPVPDARIGGSSDAHAIQRHSGASSQRGSPSKGPANREPRVPGLGVVRYQEPRQHSAGVRAGATSPSDGDNIGIATYHSKGKERASNMTRYKSKNWMGHSGIVFEGHELLDTANAFAQATTAPFLMLPVAPSTWVGTRAQLQVRQWQFFRVRKLELAFTSSLPTTQAGELFLSYLSDVEQDIFVGANASFARKIMSLNSVKTFNAWQSQVLHVEWPETTPWTYALMNGDDRLQTQGSLVFGAMVNPFPLATILSMSMMGILEVRYVIEFCDQIVDASADPTYIVQATAPLGVGTAGGGTVSVANTVATLGAVAANMATFRTADIFLVEIARVTGTPISSSLYDQSVVPNLTTAFLPTAGTCLYAMRDATDTAGNTLRLFSHVPTDYQDDPLVWSATNAAGMSVDYLIRPYNDEL